MLTIGLGALVMLVSVEPGAVLIVVLALFGCLAYYVHFTLLEHRLEEYRGRVPMPALGLGMWGFNIVDDRPIVTAPARSTSGRASGTSD